MTGRDDAEAEVVRSALDAWCRQLEREQLELVRLREDIRECRQGGIDRRASEEQRLAYGLVDRSARVLTTAIEAAGQVRR